MSTQNTSTDTLQELREKLTDSYAPLHAAEQAVQDNAIALVKAVVFKYVPDATFVGLDHSDQTENRVVSDGEIDVAGDKYQVDDVITDDEDREHFDHGISDLAADKLPKDAAGYPFLPLT